MNKNIAISMLTLLFSVNAFSQIAAGPYFKDLGSVKAPDQRSTIVTFANLSSSEITDFAVSCLDNTKSFQCVSKCPVLPADGECKVEVIFSPHSGDGQRKFVHVFGKGSDSSAHSQIFGIDQAKE